MLHITATEKTKKLEEVKFSILHENEFQFYFKMNFNFILQQFDDYCSPQKNDTFLRYKFFS